MSSLSLFSLLLFFTSFQMNSPSYEHERRKKSDKAKDKANQPSSKHVRLYEHRLEKHRDVSVPKSSKNKK